jgi:hypothetical protein
MKPYKHQIAISSDGYKILKQHGIIYYALEERTGKTLISILTFELTSRNKCLVLTKKKSLKDWIKTLQAYSGNKPVTIGAAEAFKLNGKQIYVTNYHSAVKLKPEFDMVILDESHSYLSAYPKRGTIWKSVKALTKGLPIVYLSATPNAQGYQLLFNQLALSNWSPWAKYVNFYKWFNDYGIPNKVRTPYGLQETYSKCKDDVWDSVKHLFISYTRRALDFEHEPEDILHYIELSDKTKDVYNKCIKDEVLKYGNLVIPLDSPMKLRTSLHMLEGGVVKDGDNYHVLDLTDKVDAILKDFGDSKDIVIMYNYIAEGTKLSKHFKNATLLQGTSYAEGVDLSAFEHLIIYSQDFSTARHSQRRARQANKARSTPIKVHFYLVKGAISEQVYTTVSVNKTNFIDSLFKKEQL